MKRERQSEGVLLHAILYSAGEKKKKNKNKKRFCFCLWRRWMISRERERKREKKKKTSLLLLKSMRVFFCMRRRTFPTVMQICAIGSSGPSGAPSTPILIYFTLLYFTSSYNFCVFNNNEEIEISSMFVCCSFFSSFLSYSVL